MTPQSEAKKIFDTIFDKRVDEAADDLVLKMSDPSTDQKAAKIFVIRELRKSFFDRILKDKLNPSTKIYRDRIMSDPDRPENNAQYIREASLDDFVISRIKDYANKYYSGDFTKAHLFISAQCPTTPPI
jgi:hypothetical protein